ncbi:MAG TPA: hypothetical protein VLG74_09885 [Blastocatellia bacterium]|nr:hypothetical protein [Blastocatellia bacterium]
MQRCDWLINSNVRLLTQGLDLLERLDDASYSNANAALSLNAACSHFRHCIDFYNCFLETIETGKINYDLRPRNNAVERDRKLAIAEIGKIIEEIGMLSLADGQKEVHVVLEGTTTGAASAWSRSSVMRELQSLLSHTIHHYALIALSLRLQGVEPGKGFGVAPSTLEYWGRTG